MSTAADRRAFVDTSAYFAAANRRDAGHLAAAATLARLNRERRRLITTNVILFELHGLLVNRIGRQIAWSTIDALRASQTVVRVRSRDESRAEEILAQYEDKDFAYVDALSFAVMERLGIERAFTLDRHFAQFGFLLVALEVPGRAEW